MVLLVGINAKYIHTTLAVRSLQANAGKYRKDVEIAEYTINHRREEIFQDIYRRKPEAVGFLSLIHISEPTRPNQRRLDFLVLFGTLNM